MPRTYFNQQNLNLNSVRSYPLTEWATKKDQTETITLPDSFLVELVIPVHFGVDVEPEKFYLHTLTIYPTGYNIAFGYNDGSSSPPIIAAVNVAKSTHTENRVYAVTGIDDFAESIGQVSVGLLDEIDALPPGKYVFDYADGSLEVGVIRPQIRTIQSITVVNGIERSEELTGHIELVAGTNFQLVATQIGDANPQIQLNAIDGAGLTEDCECDEESVGPPIKTINGIPPLPNGNFIMTGDDCLILTPIQNGLQLDDTCSKPCCGCDELTAIINQIERFSDSATTVQQYAASLGAEVQAMSSVVLASRTGQHGCIPEE